MAFAELQFRTQTEMIAFLREVKEKIVEVDARKLTIVCEYSEPEVKNAMESYSANILDWFE
jgi:hypothetical protein